MFRLYSKGCEYAIRALLHSAPIAGRAHFTARHVCRKARLPESFTRKTLQDLVQKGFLRAVTGPGGGYALTRAPKAISILSIIQAVDGPEVYGSCVMGLPQCDDRFSCPMHATWKGVRTHLKRALASKTLQDFIDTIAGRRAAARGRDVA
ncbi:MAG: Rrf2 family transcriptional regulator [Candidatus Omnitrophica bacterium]|nr:Rrf2 family transcriptional regulator [Candidatus Omnitrophota bacterium]